MTRKKQTRGNCIFCGREMTKGGLSKHLRSCEARMQAQDGADKKRGSNQTIYHLQVQDSWNGNFWLHLEMNGSDTLEDLDAYLRAIWLECCGHLSAFHVGSNHYTQIFEDGWSIGNEKPMTSQVGKIFSPGMSIPYEYDFGSTTELLIKVVSERKGKSLTKHPIFLMSRNKIPDITCMDCDEPATLICLECMYEGDEPCELCEAHWKTHQHGDENYGGPMPLVNSPRTGICGYDGPAEPPY